MSRRDVTLRLLVLTDMNKVYFFCHWLVILCLMACSSGEREDKRCRIYDIDIKCDAIYPYSNFMEVKKIISLETLPKSILKNIERLRITNDRIFVLSRRDVVKVFSQKGKYLYSIGEKGLGPEEIRSATDFDISPKGDKVAIWDREGFKLNIYNLKGDFLKSVSSKKIKWGFRFCWLAKNRFLLSSLNRKQEAVDGQYQVYLLDENLDVIKGCVPYNEKHEKWGVTGPVFTKNHNGSVNYRHPLGCDIYEIKENAVKKISLDFGMNYLPESRMAEYATNRKLIGRDYMSSDFIFLVRLWELPEYIYGRYGIGGLNYSILINKKDSTHLRYRHTNSFDILSDFGFVGTFNGLLVGKIEPYQLKEKLSKVTIRDRKKYTKYIEFWKNIVKDKLDTDNPILVFLKPKDFQNL